jgi:hypothetical protein
MLSCSDCRPDNGGAHDRANRRPNIVALSQPDEYTHWFSDNCRATQWTDAGAHNSGAYRLTNDGGADFNADGHSKRRTFRRT